jgi:hypothetical protein
MPALRNGIARAPASADLVGEWGTEHVVGAVTNSDPVYFRSSAGFGRRDLWSSCRLRSSFA